MVFTDYINSLIDARAAEIKLIAEITSTTRPTVYRWLSGQIEPPLVKKQIIAAHYGKSVNELFPSNHETE